MCFQKLSQFCLKLRMKKKEVEECGVSLVIFWKECLLCWKLESSIIVSSTWLSVRRRRIGPQSKDKSCNRWGSRNGTLCQCQRYASCQRKINAKFEVSIWVEHFDLHFLFPYLSPKPIYDFFRLYLPTTLYYDDFTKNDKN